MELKVHFNPLVMLGYMMLDLPQEIFCNLKEQASNLLQNNFHNAKASNKNLYGAIEHECELQDVELLEKFLHHILPQYDNFHYQNPKQYQINNSWINFQKKYEINPLHKHDGDLSFVIWLKIPFSLENERNCENVKNSNNFQGETTAFSFLFPTHDGQYGLGKHILQIDSKYEGKMILFPAFLTHIVYPFYTSDDYRISVAGNISVINNG